jgi:hypothetical protein
MRSHYLHAGISVIYVFNLNFKRIGYGKQIKFHIFFSILIPLDKLRISKSTEKAE